MIEDATLPLVAVVGPTASGKSALGVWLAEQLGGEVVACDSTQLYRGFDIGTAKPSVAERRGVPHHLIDVLAAEEPATAGGYRQMALAVLADLRRRARLPIFTVGTGLYLRALFEGLADVPQRSEELRERLRFSARKHGPGHLRNILKRLDAEAARKISVGDEQKLIRAIEVCLITKRPLTELHRSGRAPLQGWRALKIGLAPDREALYGRIHARTLCSQAAGSTRSVPCSMAGYAKTPSRSTLSVTANCAPSRKAGSRWTTLAPRFSKPLAATRSASSPGFAANPLCIGSQALATKQTCKKMRWRGSNPRTRDRGQRDSTSRETLVLPNPVTLSGVKTPARVDRSSWIISLWKNPAQDRD